MMGQDMLIKNLFERDIFRPINGVVKADQLDDTSIWQELDEFVVTREMYQHLDGFFSSYLDAITSKNDPDIAGRIGIWVATYPISRPAAIDASHSTWKETCRTSRRQFSRPPIADSW